MANLTTILGTDSLSSSRIVINDNFSLINSELADITSLLDTSAETITLSGNAKAATLTIASGATNRFVVSSSQITASLEAIFEEAVVLENALQLSEAGYVTSLPSSGNWQHSTYIVDSTSLSGSVALTNGSAGQEVTIIPSGGSITFNNIYGTTSVVVSADGALTIRYISHYSGWMVVSAVRTTINY